MESREQVCKKLIEKELTLDTLEEWYREHRTDFYDGNEDPDLKKELDNIPDNVKLDIDVFQDEEDKRQHETFVHNSIAMQARPFLYTLSLSLLPSVAAQPMSDNLPCIYLTCIYIRHADPARPAQNVIRSECSSGAAYATSSGNK
jgi:hypothetical protein